MYYLGRHKCRGKPKTSPKSKKKLLPVSNQVHIISLLLLMINVLDVDKPLPPDPFLPAWKWDKVCDLHSESVIYPHHFGEEWKLLMFVEVRTPQ